MIDKKTKNQVINFGSKLISRVCFLAVLLLLSGCVTNAVTGKSQLRFVDEEWEMKVGAQAYAPSVQSQGGEYLADPKVQAYVQEVMSKLAIVSDRRLPYEIMVLNNSVPNAWALPSGKMAINRGLLVELNSEAELAAVVGHEIVHAAAAHGASGQTRGVLLQGALVVGAIITEGDPTLMTGASLGAQILNQTYGRGAELESDEYGMLYMSRAGYDPVAAVDLQKTFVRLSGDKKTDWINGLFSSHPPSQERVDANIKHAKALPQGGFMGVEIYQETMAHLKETQPAYKAFEEAKLALRDGNNSEARTLLASAKKLEPNEALFHILDGDIDYYDKKYAEAIVKYNLAIEKNPRYFESKFSRGMAYFKLDNFDKAYPDLNATEEVFPGFGLNRYYLGLLEEKRGNIKTAVKYLNSVANPETSLGEKSIKELERIAKSHPQYFKK